MTERYPAAYIRRSAADADNPGDVSREVQESAVRELAARDGYNGHVRYFVDWAKSAAEEKEAARTEFRAMLAEVEAGRVSIIYAYALDRLARSTTTFARLLKAAKDQGVRVVTQREGDLSDTGNPTSWAFGFLVSFFAEFELRMSKARAASARERRLARGDRFGHAAYGFRHARDEHGRIIRVLDPAEPLAAVLEAYDEAGTVQGACKLLSKRGIRAPGGGVWPEVVAGKRGVGLAGLPRWGTSTLTRILEANAPDRLPARTPAGLRLRSTAMLAQLLRCPFCGRRLTPNVARGQYWCAAGAMDREAHPRYTVQEAALMPWVQAEAARLHPPFAAVQLADDDAARRAELTGRRVRISDNYEDGVIDKPTRDAKLRAVDDALGALDAAGTVAQLPTSVDWSAPPADINGFLRALWDHVELDADMRPVRAEWNAPAWRSEG